MVRERVARWLPAQSPTWLDVVIGVSTALSLVGNVVAAPFSRGWFVVGFVAFVVAAGPGANSAFGARVGRWFQGIGKRGRGASILAFAAAVGLVRTAVDVPSESVLGFVNGIFLGIVVSLVVFVASAGEIDGWIRHRS